MSIQKQPKKKISVAISQINFDKIKRIIKLSPEQNTSSVIDTSLDMSLEEVKDLLKNPVELEKELLKRRLADLNKIKKEKGSK